MFDEASAVERLVLDRLIASGWTYIHGPDLPRTPKDVLLEPVLRDALIRLNPDVAAHVEHADDIIYRLRAVVLGVAGDGLVRSNEEFMAWVRGERTMPIGPGHEHVTIKLLEDDPARTQDNSLIVANQVTTSLGPTKRFDVVCFVNGLPLVVGEAKTPVRPAVSWVDGAAQVHDDYEVNAPAFFVPNVFSFATEGKELRYGGVRMPLELWAPWRPVEQSQTGLGQVQAAVGSLLRPDVLLDMAVNFTAFATDRQRRKIKVLARYQQFQGANAIIERVVAGKPRKGLIWHFQGSGKSLLMVFCAQKLRRVRQLRNPTVVIVVDRIDLDTQITATFSAADVPNMVATDSRAELRDLLARDARKVIITTIHKFGEAPGQLNDRDNIILLVDEAHRTQEGDLGRAMREALPNAFLFGLTGTPINAVDRNTFAAFGHDGDVGGYLSRYSFEESIRDGATLPLRFEARSVDLRINREALDEGFAALTRELTDADRVEVSKRAGRFSLLAKSPSRVDAVVEDIARHFRAVVAPAGLGAQIVTIDQEACVMYKAALDDALDPEVSDVVISVGPGAPEEWKRRFGRTREAESALLDRYRDPADPLKILIVTAKLLTGFDAPNLQCMYLDKPLRDHTLLQAICRTNRPAPGKTHGLIVDYLGIFDDVAQALMFDDEATRRVVSDLAALEAELEPMLARCVAHFPGVDRALGGWEGLLAAQEALPDNESRDAFAADFSALTRTWEALSPRPILTAHEADYRWLAAVYESLRPPSGNGKLLWHALGAKTTELIHQNVRVQAVHDDLEALVLDAELIEGLHADPDRLGRRVEVSIMARLRRHGDDPIFVELSERLENLRLKHEQGVLASLDFLKGLLQIARDVVLAEKAVPAAVVEDEGRAALTALFESVRTAATPIIVERVVADIDDIVRVVRFDGWQRTERGERDVKKALRRALLKYRLHAEQELFDQSYAYIRQYY